MKLRYVSLAEPRTETVPDHCPACRANLLAPGSLRCHLLTDVVRDQVTHDDDQPDELQWDNMTGDSFGDLREPMQWRCSACDALISPTRSARPYSRWTAAVGGALVGALAASTLHWVSAWSTAQPIEAPISAWWSIVPSPAALPQIVLLGMIAVLFFVMLRGRGASGR